MERRRLRRKASHPRSPSTPLTADDTSSFDRVHPPARKDTDIQEVAPARPMSSAHLPLFPTSSSTLSSASTNPGVGSIPNVPSASLSTTLDGLRALVAKRITAWTYLKNAGEGRVYWFNTVLLSTEDLRTTFPNDKMRNRTTRFAVLGMSLSALLDISPAHDFLRGLLSLTHEFEAVPEERYGGKNQPKSIFKVGSRSKRAGGAAAAANGGADFSMGLPQEGGEASFLFTPNIPFDLDYFQVLITTCELLIETYAKIASYLGPATTSAGLFPQPPGVGVGVAQRGSVGLSQALADVVYKVDGRLKKLVTLLSKEIDTLARQAIKNELSAICGGEYGSDLLE
ncbi:hypothetical protein JCM3770_001621 [Rhodotorula araucariae]